MSISESQIRALPAVAFTYDVPGAAPSENPANRGWVRQVGLANPGTNQEVRNVQELIRRQDVLSVNGQPPSAKEVAMAEDANRWRFFVRASDETSAEHAWLRHFAAQASRATNQDPDDDVSLELFIDLVNRARKAVEDNHGKFPPK